MASLNWQVYDRGMQVNEGMFIGSPGWVEKPRHMRKGGVGKKDLVPSGRERLVGEIAGISSRKSHVLNQSVHSWTFFQSQLPTEKLEKHFRLTFEVNCSMQVETSNGAQRA